MTEDERQQVERAMTRMKLCNSRTTTGDAYLDGLVWAIGFVYRFAFVAAVLLGLAWLLGRALHDR